MKKLLIYSLLLCGAIQFMSGDLAADMHVLCYHSFLGREKVEYDFSVADLRNHMQTLRDHGYKFITLNDLLNKGHGSGKEVLITIDDGNRSVYAAYHEVFKPMGIKPVLAIYPNIIERQPYALTWQQLKELSDDGCDIAAHGFYHLKINQKLYDQDQRSFNLEIYKSKEILEKKLGRNVHTFIYPFGLCTEIAITNLKKAGYRTAFTIERKRVRNPVSAHHDPYRLPRFMMTRSNARGSMASFIQFNQAETKIASSNNPTGATNTGDSAFARNIISSTARIVPSNGKHVINNRTSRDKRKDIRHRKKYTEASIHRKPGRDDAYLPSPSSFIRTDDSPSIPKSDAGKAMSMEPAKSPVSDTDFTKQVHLLFEGHPARTAPATKVETTRKTVEETPVDGIIRPLMSRTMRMYESLIELKLRRISSFFAQSGK